MCYNENAARKGLVPGPSCRILEQLGCTPLCQGEFFLLTRCFG